MRCILRNLRKKISLCISLEINKYDEKHLPLYTSKADRPSVVIFLAFVLVLMNSLMTDGCLSKRLYKINWFFCDRLSKSFALLIINFSNLSMPLCLQTISKGNKPFDKHTSIWNPAEIKLLSVERHASSSPNPIRYII